MKDHKTKLQRVWKVEQGKVGFNVAELDRQEKEAAARAARVAAGHAEKTLPNILQIDWRSFPQIATLACTKDVTHSVDKPYLLLASKSMEAWSTDNNVFAVITEFGGAHKKASNFAESQKHVQRLPTSAPKESHITASCFDDCQLSHGTVDVSPVSRTVAKGR